MNGLKVSDFIRPFSLNDEYPTHIDTFGKGGLHSVPTLVDRDKISSLRRKEGMLVFVCDIGKIFYLLGGVTNEDWIEFSSLINQALILPENYIFIGGKNGLAYPSSKLIEMKRDIIDLRREIDLVEHLKYNHLLIGNYADRMVEVSQINLSNLPTLGAATFPLPSDGISIPIPNPTFNPTSAGDWVMSGPWLPQIFAGSSDSDLSNPLTKVSSSLAMTQIRTAKNLKLLDNASFVVANKNVSFLWDNPAYLLANLDPKLKRVMELYNLGTSYTFSNAQSLGDLESGLVKNTVNNETGTLSRAVPGTDYVDFTENPIGSLVVRPYPNSKYISSVSLNIERVIETIALLAALKIAYDAYVLVNNATNLGQDVKITALEVGDAAKTTAIATLQAEVSAIISALSSLTGITIGWNLVNGISSLFGLGTAIAALTTKDDLEQLKTDYSQSFTTNNLSATNSLKIPVKLSSEISNEPAGIGSIFYCPDV